MGAQGWNPVTKKRPCDVCGGDHNCEVSATGGAAWCGRVADGSVRQNAGGQFLHILDGGRTQEHVRRAVEQPKRTQTPQSPPALVPAAQIGVQNILGVRARSWAQNAGLHLRKLASELGVTPESLEAIGAGYCPMGWYTFPEKDASGRVIGINRRFPDGQKKQLPGTARGLTYAADWKETPGPILVTEGASDYAAAASMKLVCLSRPSNTGGGEILGEMLRDVPADREIVIIAERDRKQHDDLKPEIRATHAPECRGCSACYPGLYGAAVIAAGLVEKLGRPVSFALPPHDAKDTRAWLKPRVGSDSLDALGKRFLAGLRCTTVDPGDDLSFEAVRLRFEYEAPLAEALAGEFRENGHVLSCGCPECRSTQHPENCFCTDCESHHEEVREERTESRNGCGYRRLMQHKYDRRRLVGMAVRCHTWACFKCRESILKPKWIENFSTKFRAPGITCLYRLTIEADDWNTVRSRILRTAKKLGVQAHHARIEQRPGVLIIWTNIPIMDAATVLPGAAVLQVAEDIRSIRTSRKCVSASPSWRPKKKDDSDWETVDRRWFSFAALQKCADEIRAELNEWSTEKLPTVSRAFEMTLPIVFCGDHLQSVLERIHVLSSGQSLYEFSSSEEWESRRCISNSIPCETGIELALHPPRGGPPGKPLAGVFG